jgi:dipeptidyl aminopeptidase/acylaminoacyl peptidase
MTALRGNWGLFDVEDAVGGARHLVDQDLADPDRLVISGGSAGGYTVLRALTLHPGFFRAGVCRYGISNLFGLSDTTHKFESRYNDLLLGTLPEAADRFRDRSPIYAAERLRDPVILFQGTDDEVVPKDQSDAIVESLRQRGIPHEYHVYEGEAHGFRRTETKQAYLQAMDAFLRRHVLFA